MQLMRRKVLIAGANGLLGQRLVRVFQDDYDVLGIGRRAQPKLPAGNFQYRQGDITHRQQLRDLVLEFVPNIIINAAGFTDVDGSETERELCWRVNVTGVENLIYTAQKVQARLIHFSTDYVFDGKAGPYNEAARPNIDGAGFYARSKLAGENALRHSDIHYAIVRTMVLYGTGYDLRPNFVSWLICQLLLGKTVRIVDDQFGNPTLASELASAVRALAECGGQGIYHISGSEVIDRYHFALKIAEVFDLDPRLIRPVKTSELQQAAPRPLRSGFDISKAVRELGITMSDALGGLRKYKRELASLN
ncbi:MAG: dTDP-4-dehydrorhamnose reductase [candidate division KSB1 bacterium]|nr:dTDP-4-dehydrorhamnose reductase [candidate division KSB1 bacterium]